MFQRILVGIDGSTVSRHALQTAVQLAKALNSRVRIVHVIDLGPLYEAAASGVDVSDVERTMVQDGRNLLAQAQDVARQGSVTSETALLPIYGTRIIDTIVDDAKQWTADLIVLGTHGRHGLGRLILGSVAEGVARSSPIPVLLVRGPAHGP
ncbi:MAG TPA: universal stress protein [Chloroflexota bacterium]|nr:universal stress protein [Chloroflexota bacterium]